MIEYTQMSGIVMREPDGYETTATWHICGACSAVVADPEKHTAFHLTPVTH